MYINMTVLYMVLFVQHGLLIKNDKIDYVNLHNRNIINL